MKPAYKSAIWAALVLLLAVSAYADSQVRIVRLSSIEGSVRVERSAGQGAENAILNMPITQDMVLRTGADGRAEVEFEDGTLIHLVPSSSIGFKQLALRSSGDKISTIEVLQGTAYFNVHRKGHDEFSLIVAGRQVPVSKSAQFRVLASPDEVKLAVSKGELSFENRDEQMKVRKGEELTLHPAEGAASLASHVERGEYDAWAKQRTDYHDRYYSASAYKSYPYYGRGDLGFYGGWYDVAGFGPIWRPYNTAFNWDPFSNGYWAWYPSSGYMWVSGYPWGWLPYRYGSWAYVPGWGWGWAPYGNWHRWRQSPGLVNPPSGYRPPAPPAARPTLPLHPPAYVGNPHPGAPGNRPMDDPGIRSKLPKQPPFHRRPGDGVSTPGSVGGIPVAGAPNAALPPQKPAGVNPPPARPPQVHRGVVEHPAPDFEPGIGRAGRPDLNSGRHSDSGYVPSRQSAAPAGVSQPSGASSSHSPSSPSPAPRAESGRRSERPGAAPRTGRNTN